jgi:L-aspartate oxidase
MPTIRALPGIRALPAMRVGWRRDADVVVVGSGVAGISAALTAAAAGLRVLVITKELAGGATPLAQGGLAAAIGPGDSAASHVSDTRAAGAGLCDPETVAALAAGAPMAIDWLTGHGARLDRRALHLEGGHSHHRIVHSGDATGAEVHRALRAALLAADIEIFDRAVALDLLLREPGEAGQGGLGGRAVPPGGGSPGGWPPGASRADGLVAATIDLEGELDPGLISARAVVLAAGGLGQAFATTTNPPGATGDALAIAARAGAVLRDPEFVQFHPTVLWLDGATGQRPLITEALRGAGAVLRDLDGQPLMAGHDPRGDLAPRDVVSARMQQAIGDGGGHLWLDATALGRDVLEDGFPTVTAACRKYGIDPVTEPIPVAPGAHYSCGGILAGMDGRTSIAGLYAVGEAASTGVHGANRLASNSLTEAVIAGRRGGAAIGRELARGSSRELARGSGREFARGSGEGLDCAIGVAGVTSIAQSRSLRPQRSMPAAGAGAAGQPAGSRWLPPAGGGVSPAGRAALAAAMSSCAGVLRDQEGLATLVRALDGAAGARVESAGNVRDKGLDLQTVEATNLHAVSAVIAAAALRRAESRGCHRRADAPGIAAEPWHTLVRWDGRRLLVTEEAL